MKPRKLYNSLYICSLNLPKLYKQPSNAKLYTCLKFTIKNFGGNRRCRQVSPYFYEHYGANVGKPVKSGNLLKWERRICRLRRRALQAANNIREDILRCLQSLLNEGIDSKKEHTARCKQTVDGHDVQICEHGVGFECSCEEVEPFDALFETTMIPSHLHPFCGLFRSSSVCGALRGRFHVVHQIRSPLNPLQRCLLRGINIAEECLSGINIAEECLSGVTIAGSLLCRLCLSGMLGGIEGARTLKQVHQKGTLVAPIGEEHRKENLHVVWASGRSWREHSRELDGNVTTQAFVATPTCHQRNDCVVRGGTSPSTRHCTSHVHLAEHRAVSTNQSACHRETHDAPSLPLHSVIS